MGCKVQGHLSAWGSLEDKPSKVVPELGCSCSQPCKNFSANVSIIPIDL